LLWCALHPTATRAIRGASNIFFILEKLIMVSSASLNWAEEIGVID
jgi:hypothetical protein